jgi:hypothetical protein
MVINAGFARHYKKLFKDKFLSPQRVSFVRGERSVRIDGQVQCKKDKIMEKAEIE